MKQIRLNVFETNSSSSHSLVMGSIDEYNKFKKGELCIDMNNNRFITIPTNADESYVFFNNDIEEIKITEYITKCNEKVLGMVFEYPC